MGGGIMSEMSEKSENGRQMIILLERTHTILEKVEKSERWQKEFEKCYHENQLNSSLERAAISSKTIANEKEIADIRAELREQRAEQDRQRKVVAEVETLIKWSKVVWVTIIGLVITMVWGMITGSITIVVP